MGVTIVTIGFGTDYDRNELLEMSGGDESLVYHVDDFQDLDAAFTAEIQNLVCTIST